MSHPALFESVGEAQGRPQGSPPLSTPPPPLQRYEEISPAVLDFSG